MNPVKAGSHLTMETNSKKAGEECGRKVVEKLNGDPVKAVIVYTTINHDQQAVLDGLRSTLDPNTQIIGCSTQGIMANGAVHEAGYACGVMALGGSALRTAMAMELNPQDKTLEKGRSLGAKVKKELGAPPSALVVLYDSLCGVDVELFVKGIREQISSPIIGGGASHPWGPMNQTFQYFDGKVISKSAIVLALDGPFKAHVGLSHGAEPIGVKMKVTRSEGNTLLELDGRPAWDIWQEVTGIQEGVREMDDTATWVVGVRRGSGNQSLYVVRGVFGIDKQRKGLILQASIPAGEEVMIHHRTTNLVLDGARSMGDAIRSQLAQQKPWAVLGFECGARTSPFLGREDTLSENLNLQKIVGPHADWLGMMAWGEIAPCGGKDSFHNLTYPLLILAA